MDRHKTKFWSGKRSWLLVPAVVLVIMAAFILPSPLFHLLDTQVIEKRVQQAGNLGDGLTIGGLTIMDKIDILNILAEGDDEQNLVMVSENAAGVKRSASQAIETAGKELERLLPGISKYMLAGISLDQYCDNYDVVMVTDRETGNAFYVWSMSFTFLGDIGEVSVVLDDTSGVILAGGIGGFVEGVLEEYFYTFDPVTMEERSENNLIEGSDIVPAEMKMAEWMMARIASYLGMDMNGYDILEMYSMTEWAEGPLQAEILLLDEWGGEHHLPFQYGSSYIYFGIR